MTLWSIYKFTLQNSFVSYLLVSLGDQADLWDQQDLEFPAERSIQIRVFLS